MSFRRPVLTFILFFMAIFLIQGCSIIRDTKLEEIYHDITARYNGYFNANEIMKDIEETVRLNTGENYNEILPVFEFPNEQIAKQVTPKADEVIKKCTKVVQKHPDSKWADNCYFLIAKAYFYKQDFYAAIETFQYVSTKYSGLPTAYKSSLWIALSNLQLDKGQEAEAIMTLINSNKDFPEELNKERWLADAHIQIAMEDHRQAVDRMAKAVPLENKKPFESRYMFILGQLYQQTDSCGKAIQQYRNVIKKNPDYQLTFNARMSIARCAQDLSLKDMEEVKKSLHKMLKDDKNIDYFDQIYYQLAQLELSRNNIPGAMEYLKKSIAASEGNSNQKGRSYHALAKFYYGEDNYRMSHAYYDSAVQNLSNDYEDYDKIAERKLTLDRLMANKEVIRQEDSLQTLANLPPEQLEEKIDEFIEQEKKAEEERQQMLEQQKQQNQQQSISKFNGGINNLNMDDINPNANPLLDMGRKTDWPFYSASALGIGLSEFRRQWGNRQLEDNWRRSQRERKVSFNQEQNTPDEGDSTLASESNLTAGNYELPEQYLNAPEERRQYYLNIPFTQPQKKASDARIQEAMLILGKVYHEDLEAHRKAIAILKDLNERFPDNQYELTSYYYLYKAYRAVGEESKSGEYKNLILAEYPESDYAELLKSTAGKLKDNNTNPELERLYKNVFESYRQGNCSYVREQARMADARFRDNYLRPKLDYLVVLCEGKQDSLPVFKNKLEEFIEKYPDAQITEHARNLINYMESQASDNKKSAVPGEPEASLFSFNGQTPHHYVMLFSIREKGGILVKQKLMDYNKEYYGFKKLKVSDRVYGGDRQMMVVKGFNNQEEARKYLRGIREDEMLNRSLNLKSYEHYTISEKDFNTVLKDEKLARYIDLYKDIENKEE